jgi:hypothetical protein
MNSDKGKNNPQYINFPITDKPREADNFPNIQ